MVGSDALLNTDTPRALKNMTTIQISKVKIIFLLPNNNTQNRFEVSKEMLEKHLPEKAEEYNVMREGVK